MLPTEIEEYLCFNADADYANVKFVSATFDKSKIKLTAEYVYTEAVEDKIADLKPKLEKLFTDSVNLPIKYVFTYTKAYMDEIVLRLKIKEFLALKFAVMAGAVKDSDIKIEFADNAWSVNLFLSAQFAAFLEYSRPWSDFKAKLAAENFNDFNFYINAVAVPESETSAAEDPDDYEPPAASARVDKSYRIKNQVYLFGRPIKERPIKIEFLTLSPDDQIIAGEISKLTKREYTRGNGEKRNYFTFTLNDGDNTANCVFFPNKSNYPHFTRLQDGDFVAALGIYGERRGWKSFNISGMATAERA